MHIFFQFCNIFREITGNLHFVPIKCTSKYHPWRMLFCDAEEEPWIEEQQWRFSSLDPQNDVGRVFYVDFRQRVSRQPVLGRRAPLHTALRTVGWGGQDGLRWGIWIVWDIQLLLLLVQPPPFSPISLQIQPAKPKPLPAACQVIH